MSDGTVIPAVFGAEPATGRVAEDEALMRYQRLALVGTVAAFSLVAAGCTGSNSPGAKPSASTTGGTSSGSAVASVARGGVVTITMAIVGDPGNPSVGVIQTFGGPTGQFVDPPENKGSTGIYKSCSDALAYQLEISAFGYNSGDPAIERIYPWYGFRVGVIGTP